MTLEDRIACCVCGKLYKSLSLHLHYKHDMSCDEYLLRYPHADLFAPAFRDKLSKNMTSYNKSEEHRARTAEVNKRRWADPVWREEAKKRAGDTFRDLFEDPDFVERHALRNMSRRSSNVFSPIVEFRGRFLRSKLEVALAEFFETQGYDWEYEKSAFSYFIGDKLKAYVPDFYVVELDLMIEVKERARLADEFKLSVVRDRGYDVEVVGWDNFEEFKNNYER